MEDYFILFTIPFESNRHNEEYGDRHCDVLPGVEEVREQNYVDVGGQVKARPNVHDER